MALVAAAGPRAFRSLLFSLLVAGCGTRIVQHGPVSDRGPDGPVDGGRKALSDAGGDAADAAGLPSIFFRPCLIATGTGTTTAGCAAVAVALRHAEPGGGTISLYVERISASTRPSSELWLVEGGPGDPATELEPLALALHEALPDVDIYLADPRGTGLSTPFDCPSSIAENAGGDPLPACAAEIRAKWGSDSAAFSVTESAWDLVSLIRRTHRSGADVFMFGRSYGAYVVNRVLQVAPELIRGVVLDSGAPAPGEATTLVAASRPVEAGALLLDLCKKDAVCAQHLGNDPATFARTALDSAGGCASLTSLGWSRVLVQQLLSVGLESPLRGLIPPAFFRLGSCTHDGAAWFDRLATQVVASVSADDVGSVRKSSLALFAHVFLSELIGGIAPSGSLPAEETTDLFSVAHELEPYDAVYDSWPRYPADEWTGRWASASVPRLVIHGALDSRVPISSARAVIAQAPVGAVTFVEFPTGKHLIVGQYPDSTGTDCGIDLMRQFLRAPEAAPDAACAKGVAPLAFTAPASVLHVLSASGDPWN